jgi:hypothetical protein
VLFGFELALVVLSCCARKSEARRHSVLTVVCCFMAPIGWLVRCCLVAFGA